MTDQTYEAFMRYALARIEAACGVTYEEAAAAMPLELRREALGYSRLALLHQMDIERRRAAERAVSCPRSEEAPPKRTRDRDLPAVVSPCS